MAPLLSPTAPARPILKHWIFANCARKLPSYPKKQDSAGLLSLAARAHYYFPIAVTFCNFSSLSTEQVA